MIHSGPGGIIFAKLITTLLALPGLVIGCKHFDMRSGASSPWLSILSTYTTPGQQGCLSHRIKNKRPVNRKSPLKAKIELHSEAFKKGLESKISIRSSSVSNSKQATSHDFLPHWGMCVYVSDPSKTTTNLGLGDTVFARDPAQTSFAQIAQKLFQYIREQEKVLHVRFITRIQW